MSKQEPQKIPKVRYVLSDDGVIVMLKGKHRTVSSHDDKFEDFRSALLSGAEEQDLIDLLDAPGEKIKRALRNATDLVVVAGVVTFKGHTLPASVSLRLQQMLASGYDLVPLSRFMSRLHEHPSPEMIPEIYDFLASSKLPLTEDGFLVAYVAATHDYKDPQTNLNDMRVGRACEIPRNIFGDGLEPPGGLKFYTFSQMPYEVQRALLVQIDPTDITLVDSAKGRPNERFAYLTCRYIVVQEDAHYHARKTSLLDGMVITIQEP